MKKAPSKVLIIVALIAAISLNGIAQEGQVNTTSSDTTAAEKPSKKQLLEENTSYKPILGLGAGFYNFFGEVNHNRFTSPSVSSHGVSVFVGKNVSPSFALDFNFTLGKLHANEKEGDFRNFESSIVTGSVALTYNFAALQRPDRILNPFISAGIGYLNFDSKSDLKDKNGITYHVWGDGSLRSLAEDDPLAENAVVLQRDHVYETDLREANLDSLGKYPTSAVSFPFTFGFNFKVSPRTSMRLSSTLYYNLTDLIDNYTSEGKGARKGDDSKDMFLYNSLSLHFDLFSPKKEKKTRYDDIDFDGLVADDADKDGVLDTKDKCPDSPASAQVDKDGCPVDTDGDGIPDYIDEEKSPSGAVVDPSGVTIGEENLNKNRDTLGTERARMYEIYPEMKEQFKPIEPPVPYNKGSKVAEQQNTKKVVQEEKTNTEEKIISTSLTEDKIALVDRNNDGIITPDEVEKIIDEFFEGSENFTTREIFDIIDYLFEQ